jgi:hypothetical protein
MHTFTKANAVPRMLLLIFHAVTLRQSIGSFPSLDKKVYKPTENPHEMELFQV